MLLDIGSNKAHLVQLKSKNTAFPQLKAGLPIRTPNNSTERSRQGEISAFSQSALPPHPLPAPAFAFPAHTAHSCAILIPISRSLVVGLNSSLCFHTRFEFLLAWSVLS